MTKKLILIIVFLATALFLSGCTNIEYGRNRLGLECLNIKHAVDRDQCYLNSALMSVNPALCKNISNSRGIQYCVVKVVKANGDSNACRIVENSSYRLFCYAWVKRDVTICDKISVSDVGDLCVSRIAQDEADYSLCRSVISLPAKDECYLGVAYRTTNISVCEGVINQEMKYACYTAIAVNNQDSNICTRIMDYEYRSVCFNKVI